MKKFNYYAIISLILVASSAIMFYIHYLAFGQAENTAYYSTMNLCFIPINSLIVTIVFERLINYREKNDRINKLNMLVGIFFNEVGCDLMKQIIISDKGAKEVLLQYDNLKNLEKNILNHNCDVNINMIDLKSLKELLLKNNDLFINLISNENLHLHETFTDLLMAVVHLRDEILFIEKHGHSEIDYTHLEGDIIRVYKSLNVQWINYLKYLRKNYPFLYNNAIRINPFINELKTVSL